MRLCFLLIALSACGPRLDETREDGLRHLTGLLQANGQGVAGVDIDVAPDETAMLVTAITGDPMRTHVRGLESPDALVFDAFDHAGATESKTNGGYVAAVASLNWPVDETDPGLSEGRWRLEVGLVDEADEWAPGDVAVDVLLKEDPDLTRGAVHASIVFAGGLDGDAAVQGATEAALEVWADLYAGIGIELTWDTFTYDGGALAPPGLGMPDVWEEISEITPLRTVTVVVAPEIVGEEFEEVFGIAGDIPGPLVTSSRSGVIVSTLLAAGRDGVFSPAEQRLFGETMAHEAGHYLGLFHPVEVEWSAWDSLADTPLCETQETCQDELGRNLMFPYPLCNMVGVCTPQDQLTDDQAGVANRHVAVE